MPRVVIEISILYDAGTILFYKLFKLLDGSYAKYSQSDVISKNCIHNKDFNSSSNET